MNGEFYTFKGYQLAKSDGLTASMEDYLEMAYRLSVERPPLKIHNLAANLNVKPSSASKMAANLKRLGYMNFEKYGEITLTPKGELLGKYLLHRHEVVSKFLRLLNNSEELAQAEKIEHFFDEKTIANLEILNEKILNELSPK